MFINESRVIISLPKMFSFVDLEFTPNGRLPIFFEKRSVSAAFTKDA